MSTVYPTLPRLAVRDSFDDEDLSDVDDEVFIRDGRNGGLKLDDEGGVKRPLMAPRRKYKASHLSEKRRLPCRALLGPCCYGVLALLVLLGLIVLVIFAVSVFPMPLSVLKNWLTQGADDKAIDDLDVVPCTSLAASVVWTRTLPKLTSEAPLRSNDVNGDNVEDIIVGFSTGLDAMDAPQSLCTLYFGGQTPCLGGVVALDGATGETIWTHWTTHAIFSIDCGLDLTDDKVKDCIISGRGGIMQAINGHDGSAIWELPLLDSATPGQQRILDIYDARYVPDADGDGVGDVIASHTMQTGGTRSSDIVLISGKNGNIIHSVGLPGKEQLFLAPQTLVHPDGERIFVIATGSQQQSGGLYVVPFTNFMFGDLKMRQLHQDVGKGELLPPVLIDVTLDGTEDIVAAMFNSMIIAYDGRSYEQLWNYTVPNSEIISIPIPGYYNDDNVPDLMVKHQIGPGFPVYYYTVATILDGKTGEPLLEEHMEDSLSGQMSGLSITVDGFGNDWFLHWSADCLNHVGDKSKFQFLKSQSLISQTRADFCKLRYNSTLTTRLLALSQHVEPPGIPLYLSEDWKKLEFNNSMDPRKEAEQYYKTHPDFDASNSEMDIPLVSERSPRVHKNQHKASSFRHKDDNDIFAQQNNYYPNSRATKTSGSDYENAENYKDHDGAVDNNLETKVSDDFGSDEDWRDANKWEEDSNPSGKDYDVLYDEADGHAIVAPEINGIREQRSDGNDGRTINNDTNEVKNQLDPSMDYTNGQSKYTSKYPLEPANRSNNVAESEDYSDQSDLDFDDNDMDRVSTNVKEKRKTDRNRKLSKVGQEEIVVGEVQNSAREDPFIKIGKRPEDQVKRTGRSDRSVYSIPVKFRDTEKKWRRTKRIIERNVQSNDIIEIHPIAETLLERIDIVSNNSATKNEASEIEKNGVVINSTDRITDKRETKEVSTIGPETKAEDIGGSWLLKDIFAGVTQKDEDYASIEKIFKRESMKNRESRKKTANPKPQGTQKEAEQSDKVKRETEDKKDQTGSVNGIQRQSPTGILLPSLNKLEVKKSNSIDLVFSTFWLPPSDASVVLLQQDLDCVHRKKKQSSQSNDMFANKNQHQERDQWIRECLSERGVDYNMYREEAMDRENVRIALGQMTVYRMKLECVCPEDMLPGQTCKSISAQQSWPAYLGASTNGYFKPMKRPST